MTPQIDYALLVESGYPADLVGKALLSAVAFRLAYQGDLEACHLCLAQLEFLKLNAKETVN